MSPEELMVKLMRKARARGAAGVIGIGIAKEVTDTTCTVEREAAPTLYDVRLHAITDPGDGFVTIIPKDGSYVLYGIIGGDGVEAVLLMCSEVERVVMKKGATQYELSASGHDIKRGENTLKSALVDFISEVQKIIVINGTSPNVPALEAIKTKVNEIFK